jgi:hypothetical protein
MGPVSKKAICAGMGIKPLERRGNESIRLGAQVEQYRQGHHQYHGQYRSSRQAQKARTVDIGLCQCSDESADDKIVPHSQEIIHGVGKGRPCLVDPTIRNRMAGTTSTMPRNCLPDL